MNTINIRKISILAAGMLLMIAGLALAQEESGWHKGCSNATLQGSFAYTSFGTLLPSFAPPPFAGPFAENGRQTFDGKGETDANHVTYSANGNITRGLTLKGSYSVNPDCTGSWTLGPSGSAVHADFVIDDNGTEIRAISTDSGVIESRVYKKQFRHDRKEHEEQ